MRVRGMIDEHSQRRVLVTVLFFPRRKKGEGQERLKTSIQSAKLRLQFLTLQPRCELLHLKRRRTLLCYWDLLRTVDHHLLYPRPSLHRFQHRLPLRCGTGRGHVRSSDVEDGTDPQEETPEDSSQLGDEVKLHHFTQVGVVAGGMGLELEEEDARRQKSNHQFHLVTEGVRLHSHNRNKSSKYSIIYKIHLLEAHWCF